MVIAANDVQASAGRCSPRKEVAVCTLYGSIDPAGAIFGNRVLVRHSPPRDSDEDNGKGECTARPANGRKAEQSERARSPLPAAARRLVTGV